MSGPGEGMRPASPETRLAERAARLARLAGGGARGTRDRALASVLHLPGSAGEPASMASPAAVAAPVPAAVVPFCRAPEPVPSGGLDRLPGAGPGLIWSLQRAGIRSLADLAALSPEALADRLGATGGLIDLAAWIEFACRAREGCDPSDAPG